jgi:predicted ATP-grasp superfamily ATP-dependent carboligase
VLVAVGFAEALSAPEVVWSLVDSGFEVVAFSRRGRRAALRYSRYVTIYDITAPEEDTEAALRDLAAVLDSVPKARQTQHVLLPLDDSSIWLCSNLRTEWILAGPHAGCVDLALDKQKQIELARAVGFHVPATSIISTCEELSSCPAKFPLIVRPASAAPIRGARIRKGRNWICSNEPELRRVKLACDSSARWLVQPFLEGIGEGIFGLATEHGVVAWSAHRRLRMMNPHGSGSSACVSQVVPESLKVPVTAFVQSCGWRGMFMVEMLRTEDGRLWFVEFNGRAWGSMALSRRQSLEYPAWNVKLALDPQGVPPCTLNGGDGVVCRHLGRELMHLLFVSRGPQSRAIRNWPPLWGTVTELLRAHRRSSLYNWRKEDWRVFVSDCWYTIHDQLFKTHQ